MASHGKITDKPRKGKRDGGNTMTNHANIWAPWRMAYLRSLKEDESVQKVADSNFFRTYWLAEDRDEANLVVHRNEFGMILLNRYSINRTITILVFKLSN